jgi:hypothetical protein
VGQKSTLKLEIKTSNYKFSRILLIKLKIKCSNNLRAHKLIINKLLSTPNTLQLISLPQKPENPPTYP